MDDVATPTCYEPLDSNLPPGPQAGETVHYSATTISDKRAHLHPHNYPARGTCHLQEKRRAAGAVPSMVGIEPTPSGTKPRALPLSYATHVV